MSSDSDSPGLTRPPERHFDGATIRCVVLSPERFTRAFIRAAIGKIGIVQVTELEHSDDLAGRDDLGATDLLVLDQASTPLGGLELTREIRWRRGPFRDDLDIIVVSRDGDAATVLAAINAGASAFLVMPLSMKALQHKIIGLVMAPRPFIRSAGYVGPDRRVRTRPAPGGSERRRPGTTG